MCTNQFSNFVTCVAAECLEIPEVVDLPQQNLSDMYARLKEQPRERKLSSISRTPWIYQRKSKKIQDR